MFALRRSNVGLQPLILRPQSKQYCVSHPVTSINDVEFHSEPNLEIFSFCHLPKVRLGTLNYPFYVLFFTHFSSLLSFRFNYLFSVSLFETIKFSLSPSRFSFFRKPKIRQWALTITVNAHPHTHLYLIDFNSEASFTFLVRNNDDNKQVYQSQVPE